jgi:hypothetical protein
VKLRWLIVLVLIACGCEGAVPLTAPVSADKTVLGGLNLVLTNADLSQLAQAIRLSAGKKIEVAIAPAKIVGANGAGLQATTVTVSVVDAQAHLAAQGRVVFQHKLVAKEMPLSLQQSNGQSCALLSLAWQGAVSVSLRFARDAVGVVQVVLGATPSAEITGGVIADPSGCLAKASPGASDALAKQIRDAISAALIGRFVSAGRDVLLAVLPLELEASAQFNTQHRGESIKVSLQSGYAGPDGSTSAPGSLVVHNGQFASAVVHLGAAVQRHTCAVDAAPPKITATPLPLATPPAPAGSFLLRRAVVLDQALLAHLAWGVQRGGSLCASRPLSSIAGLSANWAATLVPALAAWVKDRPSRVRFWPGKSGGAQFLDLGDGGGVQLRLPASTLEIVAPVAGIEVVVLRVTGNIALRMKLRTGKPGLALELTGATVDSAAVTSALVNDALSIAEEGVGKLVNLLVQQALAEPLEALSVPGFEAASVVGSARVGGHLWVWLEEAPPGGG